MGFLNYVLASMGGKAKDEDSNKKTKKTKENIVKKPTFIKQKAPNNNTDKSNTKKGNNVVIFYPKNLSDLGQIVDFLATGQHALLNFEKVDKSVFQRILDFIAGAVCALGGKVENLGNNLFLFAPKNSQIINKGNLYEN